MVYRLLLPILLMHGISSDFSWDVILVHSLYLFNSMSPGYHRGWYFWQFCMLSNKGPVSPNLNPESHLFEIWIPNPSHFEIWIPENCFEIWIPGPRVEIWILNLALFEIWIQNPWSVWNLNPESLDPPLQGPVTHVQRWGPFNA